MKTQNHIFNKPTNYTIYHKFNNDIEKVAFELLNYLTISYYGILISPDDFYIIHYIVTDEYYINTGTLSQSYLLKHKRSGSSYKIKPEEYYIFNNISYNILRKINYT